MNFLHSLKICNILLPDSFYDLWKAIIKKGDRFLIFYYQYSPFFSLDRKEPKGQDCQKKSENSTVRVTEILKLTRTQ